MKARRGISFLEFLIVIIILGVVALILVPKFFDASDEESVVSMKQVLRDVRRAAEESFMDNKTYARFVPPASIGAVSIKYYGMSDGWFAEATYPNTDVICMISSGSGVIKGMPANRPVCGPVEYEEPMYSK